MSVMNNVRELLKNNYSRIFFMLEGIEGTRIFKFEFYTELTTLEGFHLEIYENQGVYTMYYYNDLDLATLFNDIGGVLDLKEDIKDDIFVKHAKKLTKIHQHILNSKQKRVFDKFLQHADEILTIQNVAVRMTYDMAVYGDTTIEKKGNVVPVRHVHIWNMIDECAKIMKLIERHPISIILNNIKDEFDLFETIKGEFEDYDYENEFGLEIRCQFDPSYSFVLYKNVLYFSQLGKRIEFFGNIKKYSSEYGIITYYLEEKIEGLIEEALLTLEKIGKKAQIQYSVLLCEKDKAEEIKKYGYTEFEELDKEKLVNTMGAYILYDVSMRKALK